MKKASIFLLFLIIGFGGGLLLTWSTKPGTETQNLPSPPGVAKSSPLNYAAPKTFSWQEIETADYATYVENLRKIGCPEPTVDDVVIADVNALYMEKAKPILQDLQQSIGRGYKNFSAGSGKASLISVGNTKLDRLNTERTGLISKLLGHEVEKFKIAAEPWGYMLKEIIADDYPYLSPEKKALVKQIKDAALAKKKSRLPAGHPMTQEDLKFLEELRRSTEKEIAKILSPDEFETYVENNSTEAVEMRRKLGNVAITDAEYRDLLKASRGFYDKYGYDYTDPAQFQAKAEDEQKFRNYLKETLGDERYQQYLKDNDPAFLDTTTFAQSASLSPQQADDLYTLRSQVELEFRSIAMSSLGADERRQKKLEALQSADERLKGLVDDNTRSMYLQSKAGQWLNNLNAGGQPRNGPPVSTSAAIGIDINK